MHQSARELVLASTSPRRRQLLEQAGYIFHTYSIKVSEIPKKNLNLAEQVQDIARRKAMSCIQSYKSPELKGYFALGADTVVIFDNEFLGKPRNPAENVQFLQRLSGKRHIVTTGVGIIDSVSKREICFHESTVVEFYPLTEEQIQSYVDSGDGLDKAGGYGIQGDAGQFVRNTFGSHTNVVGLPMEKLEKILDRYGWSLPKRTL